MRRFLKILAFVFMVPIGLLCTALISVSLLKLKGESVLSRTLSSVAEGRSLPENVRLDIYGMSVRAQEPGKFAEILQAGFHITQGHYAWFAFPSGGLSYSVDVKPDIGLLCEVYPSESWKVYCGQLHCSSKPCNFSSRPALTDAEGQKACSTFMLVPSALVFLNRFPTSLDEAVELVLKRLDQSQKLELKSTKKEDLIEYHFSTGLWIRNEFGLWATNYKLACSACGGMPCDPDAASSKILAAAWERLQGQ